MPPNLPGAQPRRDTVKGMIGPEQLGLQDTKARTGLGGADSQIRTAHARLYPRE